MRTRNPEKTVEKILSVAQELFLRQGYDKTTMQDIVNQGLSKGAIYHHFKSKRDIFEHIMHKIESNSTASFDLSPNSNALSQLRKILAEKLNDKDRLHLLKHAKTLFEDPKVFGELYKINMIQTTQIIEEYIKSGNLDGSINCKYSKETAEMITYFFSIWIGTSLYNVSEDDFFKKINYYREIFKFSGVDLIDSSLKNKLTDYYNEISKAD